MRQRFIRRVRRLVAHYRHAGRTRFFRPRRFGSCKSRKRRATG